eukprot:Rmarinus@m.15289
MTSNFNPDFYKNKNILAPMVRVGSLPLRLLALGYGADLVYSEETISLKLEQCDRIVNDTFGTVDFVGRAGAAFRTCATERENIVLQLGTGSAVSALNAATVVCRDVAAVDVNMGCPKRFSLQGGMGAALLKDMARAEDIMKTLRRNLNIPVSCKIRLLDTDAETVDYARAMEACGISALAVHARLIPQRPREPAFIDRIHCISDALQIPVIANGDVRCYEDFEAIKKRTNASSVMTARGAQGNVSIFSPRGFRSRMDVGRQYVAAALALDNPHHNTKYTLAQMHQTNIIFPEKPNAEDKATASNLPPCKTAESLCSLYRVRHPVQRARKDAKGDGLVGNDEVRGVAQRPFSDHDGTGIPKASATEGCGFENEASSVVNTAVPMPLSEDATSSTAPSNLTEHQAADSVVHISIPVSNTTPESLIPMLDAYVATGSL